ncbi:MAG: hypothetical protein ABIN58_10295 [candidate division WOR-3 bacterium]
MTYDRVYSYDEEGRLTKIQRDAEVAFEDGYSGDGVRVLKKDYDAQKEFWFSCSISCGGIPLRVYFRALGSNDPWQSGEDYMWQGDSLWYNLNQQVSSLAGDLILMGSPISQWKTRYWDLHGVSVQPCVRTQPLGD